MNRRIISVLVIGICVVLIGCGKKTTVYYSEIRNNESADVSKDVETDEEGKGDETKSGLFNLFGNKKSHSNSDSNMVNGGYIAIDGDKCYYATYLYQIGEAFLYCRDLNSNEDTTVLEMRGRIEYINVTEDKIFFVNDGLYCINKDGSNLLKLVDEELQEINREGEYLYYGNKYRLNLDGSNVEEITKHNFGAYTLNYSNGYFYYDNGGLKRRKTNQSEEEMLVENWPIANVVVYEDNIFIVCKSTSDNVKHTIYRCELDGDNCEEWAHTEIDPMYINASDGYLYCAGSGISRINIKTKEETVIYEQSAAYKPQVIDEWVYFLMVPNGVGCDTIYRIKTDGSEMEVFTK